MCLVPFGSVVISSLRGSSSRAEGWGARCEVQPCAPPLGLAAVSACNEEISTKPFFFYEAAPDPGRSPGLTACVGVPDRITCQMKVEVPLCKCADGHAA